MSAREDVSVSWNTSPRVITVAKPSADISVQELIDTVRSLEYTPDPGWDIFSYASLMSIAGKEEIGDGVYVGLTGTLHNAQLAFEARTLSTSAGTCTTADSNGLVLIDSAASFVTDGVSPGDVIINFTDTSVCSVLSVDSETQLTHELLADGTNNDWGSGDSYKVFPWETCELSGGNVVSEDDVGTQIDVLLPRFGVSYVRTASSSATLTEQALLQYSSYNDEVAYDETSPYTGTVYPVGTRQQPINNVYDARTIAQNVGLGRGHIFGDMNIPEYELDGITPFEVFGFIFQGEGKDRSNFTIPEIANVYRCVYLDAYVTGYLDGDNTLNGCFVENLHYIKGFIELCVLSGEGEIELGGADSASFLSCYSQDDQPAVINLGGGGQPLTVGDHTGSIKLTNKSGPEHATIGIKSGKIILDLTTVTNGTIEVSGIGELIDQNGDVIQSGTYGTLVVLNKLVSKEGTAQAVWDYERP